MRIILVVTIIMLLTVCAVNTGKVVNIGHVSWPGYEALSIAESEGLYKGPEVNVTRINNNTAVMTAFEQGVIDIAAVTISEAVQIQSRLESPIIIIAVLDFSRGGDAIIAQKNIKSMRDMKGRRLGLEPTGLSAFVVSQAIESASEVSLEQMQIIPVTIDDQKELFLAGKLDAVVTYEPTKSKILREDGHVIFDSTMFSNDVIDVLVSTESFLNENRDAVSAVLSGYFSALDYMATHSEKALAKAAGFERVTVDEYKHALGGVEIPGIEKNRQLLSNDNKTLKIAIDRMFEFLLKTRVIKQTSRNSIQTSDKFIPE